MLVLSSVDPLSRLFLTTPTIQQSLSLSLFVPISVYLSSRLTLLVYMQEWTFSTTGFLATYRLDIKILPDCMSSGILKGVIIRLNTALLLFDHLHLYLSWICSSYIKYQLPHTYSTYPCKYILAPTWTYTYIYTYLWSTHNHTHTYTPTYTCTHTYSYVYSYVPIYS